MAIIKGITFTGEIPKSPPHLLPDNAAQFAMNCYFGHGELRPLMLPSIKAGQTLSPWSIYTEDGNGFWSWNKIMFAVGGPIINDKYNRFYFTDDGTGISPSGAGPYVEQYGNPPSSGGPPPTNPPLLVGVPPPGSGHSTQQQFGQGGPWAPIKPTLIAENATYPPGVTDADMAINFWYERGGERFQYTDSTLLESKRVDVIPFQQYVIEVPPVQTSATTVSAFTYAVRIHDRNSRNLEDALIKDIPVAGGTDLGQIQVLSETEIVIVSNQQHIVGLFLSYTTSASGTEEIWASDFYASTADIQGTPDDAVPTVEVTMIDRSGRDLAAVPPNTLGKDSILYHQYSANSVSASKSGPQVAVTKDVTNPLKLHIKITYPVAETRAYIYTLVNFYGEESAPSEAEMISLTDFNSVLLKIIFQNQPRYREQVSAKIYRSIAGTQGTVTYNFVGWMTLKTGVYDALGNIDNSHAHEPEGGPGYVSTNPNEFYIHDRVLGSELQEECPSFGWTLPPEDLNQIIALPNGVLAAWRKNELYLSEPYRPHAWPVEYVIQFPYDIVGHIGHGGSIVVTTKAYPFMVHGIHPESMTATKLPILQAGVSKRGMVDMGPAHRMGSAWLAAAAAGSTPVNSCSHARTGASATTTAARCCRT
jgi:hypothetical protein